MLEMGIRESSSTQETHTQVLTIRILFLSLPKSEATMIPEISISKGQTPSVTHIKFQSDLKKDYCRSCMEGAIVFLYKKSNGYSVKQL